MRMTLLTPFCIFGMSLIRGWDLRGSSPFEYAEGRFRFLILTLLTQKNLFGPVLTPEGSQLFLIDLHLRAPILLVVDTEPRTKET